MKTFLICQVTSDCLFMFKDGLKIQSPGQESRVVSLY